MTIHVLDTGAVYTLLNRWVSPLEKHLTTLVDADSTSLVWIPVIVLVEAGKSKPLQQKRLEKLLTFTEVYYQFEQRLADRASESLRSVASKKCSECGNSEPSIIDAMVMAFADDYAETEGGSVVYTQDEHMTLLRDQFFTKVQVNII
jgi:hypothetical protein